jgi:DNA-binding beta-propeller fold protein YncE
MSRAWARSVCGLVVVLTALSAGACERAGLPAPDPTHLRQPTGLRLAPGGKWLFVTNGNWDREEDGGTLMAIDMDEVDNALEAAGGMGAGPGGEAACRAVDEADPTLECDEARFIDAEDTVILASGVGNIALDRPAGEHGPMRLIIPTRIPASLWWVDIDPDGAGISVDCGQDPEGHCGPDHEIDHLVDDPEEDLPQDPARVVLDEQEFRFAYVPHLLGGSLSLVALDGESGPELKDIEQDFFREDPFEDFNAAGGFSVAQRPCDPSTGNVPTASRDCMRPYLYGTHRFWPGIRAFTVAPGLDVIISGANTAITRLDVELVESRPFMGDLAFEDPAVGERLLVVQTTPAALVRMDTSLEDGEPRNEVLDTIGLCENPNFVAVYRPPDEEWLAFVSCYDAGEVAVVALSTFSMLATISVGQGANEMVIDAERRQLYVANTKESTVSIIGLDRSRSGFLRERARLGLGAGSRGS